MAAKKKTLRKTKDGWLFECALCPFASERHPTRKSADGRRKQHMAEHEGEDPAELAQPE